jgi:uncharacterized protein (TIGR03083 family)
VDYFPTITAERLAVADMLDGLSPQQWETKSLCGAWTVRDVAAHLSVVLTRGAGTFLVAAVRAGGNLHRANRIIVAREAARPTPDIVGDLRANADSRFTPPTFGPEAPLTEILLHGEDMRVPLGIADGRPNDGRVRLTFWSRRRGGGGSPRRGCRRCVMWLPTPSGRTAAATRCAGLPPRWG